jgi:predicted acyltransferase
MDSQTNERIVSIDLFRGFMVFLMIIVNYLLYFMATPLSLKHAAALSGITVVDFGAPIFFFILGISYSISLEKRFLRDGSYSTVIHFARRYFLLWLFGLLGVFVQYYKIQFGWNVLMAIGLAGILALPFMFFSRLGRFIFGLGLLVVYQLIILKHFLGTVLAYDMGGYLGAISWAGLILISSIWWSVFKLRNQKRIIQLMVFALVTSALIGFITLSSYQANKPAISFSYIMFSYTLAVSALLIFYLIDNYSDLKPNFLATLGRNPLLMYMLSGVLGLISQKILKPDSHWFFITIGGIVILTICFWVASYFNKKKLFIKI